MITRGTPTRDAEEIYTDRPLLGAGWARSGAQLPEREGGVPLQALRPGLDLSRVLNAPTFPEKELGGSASCFEDIAPAEGKPPRWSRAVRQGALRVHRTGCPSRRRVGGAETFEDSAPILRGIWYPSTSPPPPPMAGWAT